MTSRQMITAGTLCLVCETGLLQLPLQVRAQKQRLRPQRSHFPRPGSGTAGDPSSGWEVQAFVDQVSLILGLGFFIKKAEFLSNLPFPTLTSQHRYETTDRCFGECKSYKCTVFYSSVNFHVNQIRKSAIAPGKH